MRGQYTLYLTNGKIYAGLSFVILFYDIIICWGTLIIFLSSAELPQFKKNKILGKEDICFYAYHLQVALALRGYLVLINNKPPPFSPHIINLIWIEGVVFLFKEVL